MSAAPPDYSKKPLLPKWLAAIFLALAGVTAGGVALSPDARQFLEDSVAGVRSTPPPSVTLRLDDRLPALPDDVLQDPDLEVWDDHRVIWSLGYSSDGPVPAPTSMSNRTIVCDNAQAPWGDYGPLWGARCYNIEGLIQDLTLARVGDWTTGREGHGFYFNWLGDLTLRRVRMLQVGGQGLQTCFRPRETAVAPPGWPSPDSWLTLEDCEFIDCGQINAGAAVRSSWPVSLFATGGSVKLDGVTVRTELEPFEVKGKQYRSHGALFVGPPRSAAADPDTLPVEGPVAVDHAGDWVYWAGWKSKGTTFNGYFRTPVAEIIDLVVEVTDSDREELHFRNVGVIFLDNPNIVEHGGEADVVVTLDCGSFTVFETVHPLTIYFTPEENPHRKSDAVEVVRVPAGGSYSWENLYD